MSFHPSRYEAVDFAAPTSLRGNRMRTCCIVILGSTVTPTLSDPGWSRNRDNPLAASGLSRFLLQPGSLSVGVTVDPSMTIQQVRILFPRKLVGAAKSTASYLEGWKDMSFFQVLTAAEGFEPPGGGALTEPIGALVRNLATSVYLRDMGQEGFDRFMAQVKSPGLRVGFPFPYFTAPVSYTHLRAHETRHDLVCRL